MLAFVLATAAQPSSPAESPRQLWEAWYSVSAQVRTPRVDADLMAGGRLAMLGRAEPSGGFTLSLYEVLEDPWKLYWVDPLGPIGEEVKVASVVALGEETWDELARAEEKSERSASARHQEWFRTAERPRSLDGSYAFVVIGDATDRLRLAVAPNGRLTSVTNRLTDHWLPGPFGQFVARSRGDGASAGYWFWNQGEKVPHGYEPHTYHALAAALELLTLALPIAGASQPMAAEPVIWENVRERALRVLSILAPKLDVDALGRDPSVPIRMTATRQPLSTGASRLELTAVPAQTLPHVERETVFSSGRRPVSDRIRVRVAAAGVGSLEVEAGYRPLDRKKESK